MAFKYTAVMDYGKGLTVGAVRIWKKKSQTICSIVL